ncbi:uncharacterized [Tachysurus ichikawai]
MMSPAKINNGLEDEDKKENRETNSEPWRRASGALEPPGRRARAAATAAARRSAPLHRIRYSATVTVERARLSRHVRK